MDDSGELAAGHDEHILGLRALSLVRRHLPHQARPKLVRVTPTLGNAGGDGRLLRCIDFFRPRTAPVIHHCDVRIPASHRTKPREVPCGLTRRDAADEVLLAIVNGLLTAATGLPDLAHHHSTLGGPTLPRSSGRMARRILMMSEIVQRTGLVGRGCRRRCPQASRADRGAKSRAQPPLWRSTRTRSDWRARGLPAK